MRQIHTDRRPESEAERRYWRRRERLRLCGCLFVGLLATLLMTLVVSAITIG